MRRAIFGLTFGLRITKQDSRLKFELGSEKTYVPLGVIDYLVAFPGVEISSSAIKFLSKEGRVIAFVNQLGKPMSFVIPEVIGSRSAILRASQYEKFLKNGIFLGKELLKEKLLVLKETVRLPEGEVKKIEESLKKTKELQHLLAVDGQMGKLLYGFVEARNESRFRLKKRTYRPPEDPFNSVLSSAFYFFYQALFIQVNSRGLDPYLGFLHKRRGTHATLSSDLIEVIRPQIALFVGELFNEGFFKENDFEKVGKGIYLKRDKMKELIRRLVEFDREKALTSRSSEFLDKKVIKFLKK